MVNEVNISLPVSFSDWLITPLNTMFFQQMCGQVHFEDKLHVAVGAGMRHEVLPSVSFNHVDPQPGSFAVLGVTCLATVQILPWSEWQVPLTKKNFLRMNVQ